MGLTREELYDHSWVTKFIQLQESKKLTKAMTTDLQQTNRKLSSQIVSAIDDFVKKAEAVQKTLQEATSKQ